MQSAAPIQSQPLGATQPANPFTRVLIQTQPSPALLNPSPQTNFSVQPQHTIQPQSFPQINSSPIRPLNAAPTASVSTPQTANPYLNILNHPPLPTPAAAPAKPISTPTIQLPSVSTSSANPFQKALGGSTVSVNPGKSTLYPLQTTNPLARASSAPSTLWTNASAATANNSVALGNMNLASVSGLPKAAVPLNSQVGTLTLALANHAPITLVSRSNGSSQGTDVPGVSLSPTNAPA